jgi:hypothetical protein
MIHTPSFRNTTELELNSPESFITELLHETSARFRDCNHTARRQPRWQQGRNSSTEKAPKFHFSSGIPVIQRLGYQTSTTPVTRFCRLRGAHDHQLKACCITPGATAKRGEAGRIIQKRLLISPTCRLHLLLFWYRLLQKRWIQPVPLHLHGKSWEIGQIPLLIFYLCNLQIGVSVILYCRPQTLWLLLLKV